MKITKVETIQFKKGISVHAGRVGWIWVRIHTDEGLVGIGETYPRSHEEGAVIRNSLAPIILGKDPTDIEMLWHDMLLRIAYHGWAGAEIRGISAIDIALWDLLGKITNQPIYKILGGKCRHKIRIYNTCYDHVYDFNKDADKLAKELLASGIKAMKIWPFDSTALKNRGQYITNDELDKCLEPIKKIRDAVGDEMDVAMEFHGFWNLPSAVKIAQALESYKPMWLEEMLPQDNMKSYALLAKETSLPLCISERLMTRYQFRELIELGAAKFIMPDICWCGGITEAKKIASLADTYYLPIAPHNCGGPILHFASIHLAAHVNNLFILETVRKHYLIDYHDFITNMIVSKDGYMPLPEGPGLGIKINDEILKSEYAEIEAISSA